MHVMRCREIWDHACCRIGLHTMRGGHVPARDIGDVMHGLSLVLGVEGLGHDDGSARGEHGSRCMRLQTRCDREWGRIGTGQSIQEACVQ